MKDSVHMYTAIIVMSLADLSKYVLSRLLTHQLAIIHSNKFWFLTHPSLKILPSKKAPEILHLWHP